MSGGTRARQRGVNIRDAVVFLVDFRTPMLRKDAEIQVDEEICPRPASSSFLSLTLRCIADVMKSKIIARNLDAISVIFFGVRGMGSRPDWPGVHVARNLSQCDATGVKILQRIAQRLEAGEADGLLDMREDELDQLPVPPDDDDLRFGSDTAVEFDKALWAVRHQFTTIVAAKKTVVVRKQLFVFTNDPDPSRGKPSILNLCITQAKDLAGLGACMDVTLLTSPALIAEKGLSEDTQEPSKFFSALVHHDHDLRREVFGSVTLSTIYSYEELRITVRKKESTKRALRKTVLVMGENYKIGVALYALVIKARRPSKMELVVETNKPVFKLTTNRCEQVGRLLEPDEIRYVFTPNYLKTGPKLEEDESSGSEYEDEEEKSNTSVRAFLKSELIKIKALGEEGIIVYGLRKKSVVCKELSISPAVFVYPDETQLIGSTKAFVALHERMLKRNVVAVVSVRLSKSSTAGIRFALLVPQKGKYSTNNEQLEPTGFQMYYLPYENDIYTAWRKEMKSYKDPGQSRDIKEEPDVGSKMDLDEESNGASAEDIQNNVEEAMKAEGVKLARKVVSSLKIRTYDPNLFLNPDLQRFYAGLEHAAGVETSFKPQDDLLNPDVVTMQKRASQAIDQLKQTTCGTHFNGDVEAERYGTKSGKRAAEASEKMLRKAEEKKRLKREAKAKCNVELFRSRYEHGKLSSFRKPELQIYCRAHDLHDKGTKVNLLATVEEHLEGQLDDET